MLGGGLKLGDECTDGIREGLLLSRVHHLGSAGTIAISWIEQWTAPQRWTKYKDNPVYGPDQSGSWDSWTNGVSIVAHPDGKTYRMFYAGEKGEGIGVAQADICNPTVWTEVPGCPILKPRVDNWEGNKINQPRVVILTADHWRMYYSGWDFPGPGTRWAMGLAESFDGGVTWSRYGDDPILSRGDANAPDGGGACVPHLLKVDDQWMMWYTAGVVGEQGHLNVHLCLAVSDDGLHWGKHEGNPVLGDDFGHNPERNVTSRCYVRHDNGVFQMWYSYANSDYRICYAESLNGVDWERSAVSPVLDPSPAPAWDDRMVEYPEVQVVDGKFRMWFCGNGFGTVGNAEGVSEAGVEVAIRSGDTRNPDDSWSDWIAIERDREVAVSRFYQTQARLWSKHPLLSPCLSDIVVDHLI